MVDGQGRMQKIQKEGAEETDDAVLHHSGSICHQTLGLTLRTFQKYRKKGGPRPPCPPPPPLKSAHDGEDKRTNNRAMLPTLRNKAAAGYQRPVKIELLKGVSLLRITLLASNAVFLFHPRITSLINSVSFMLTLHN